MKITAANIIENITKNFFCLALKMLLSLSFLLIFSVFTKSLFLSIFLKKTMFLKTFKISFRLIYLFI